MSLGDHEERRRALESKRNLAVTAGAGTGKTTLLVSKIVRKVVDEGMDVTRLLALTFTEKAANEMRERVRRELEKAGRTEGLDRAEIGTIHSFCAHVLRQFPIEAGVAPDFVVDEGQAFRRLFERAWPRWLDRELGPEARRPRVWKELLDRVELGTLRELAEGLASFGIPEEREPGVAQDYVAEAAREAPELAGALEGKEEPRARKPRGASAGYASALRLVQDLRTVDEAFVAGAVRVAWDFAREFRLDYLARGYVSFEGMLALVHALLKNRDFPDVLEHLRRKYEYILVDEFQDTDPMQGEIIRLLAEEDRKLVPGKLFIVGDPKQSIYSFRGADIIAYQGLVDRILEQGGERVVLRTNFRSHSGILDFVNSVFSGVIVERGRLQPRYEPIEAPRERKPELPPPHLEAVLVEEASAGESREAEAEAIAEWIQAHPEVPPKGVAILLKALSDVTVYIEALRSRGIPYIVHGEKFFYATSEVVDFVNLLRAVAHPHDRVAVAAVLRSPFGALSDGELYARRKGLEPEAEGDVAILRFIARWNGEAGRMGVAELIDRIFEESYALEIARMGWHGEQAVANLLKLRQKAAEGRPEGGCTLREFLEGVNRAVRELEEEGESPLADETLDAVSILSIHRSKGLEYPVVILPDLHRQAGTRAERVVRYDWPTRTLGVRLGRVCDRGGAALSWLDRERRREEEKRLLYVAATRARERLVLLGSADARAGTYLSILLPELEKRARVERRRYRRPTFQAAPAAAGGEKPDWDAFVARWREREKRAAIVERFTSPSRLEAGEKLVRVASGVGGSERAVEIGVACHAVLERLDFGAPAVPEGTDPEAGEILLRFFRSAAFRELAEAEILARELPFVIPRGEQIVEGVIDVVYRRAGILWVADYKTDKMVKPEDYGLIREIYSDAVRRVFGTAPRFKLFYLRQGRGVEC